MPNVTIRYQDDSLATFASIEEATAQAAHDRLQPGHLNPVALQDKDGNVVDDLKKLAKCDCALCQWQGMTQKQRLADGDRPPAERKHPFR